MSLPKILFIDDDANFRRATERALEDRFDLTFVKERSLIGPTVVAKAFDLIVTDNLDLEALSSVEAPVLVYSGEDPPRNIPRPAKDWKKKGLPKKELVTWIESYLPKETSMTRARPATNPQQPALPREFTPPGTPTVGPTLQGPPQLTPEMIALLGQAYNALPPGALKTVVRQLWPYLVGALVPLILASYGAIKQIINAPSDIPAMQQALKEHTAELDDLRKQIVLQEKQLADIDEKIDRLLWLQQTGGGTKSWPTTQPR